MHRTLAFCLSFLLLSACDSFRDSDESNEFIPVEIGTTWQFETVWYKTRPLDYDVRGTISWRFDSLTTDITRTDYFVTETFEGSETYVDPIPYAYITQPARFSRPLRLTVLENATLDISPLSPALTDSVGVLQYVPDGHYLVRPVRISPGRIQSDTLLTRFEGFETSNSEQDVVLVRGVGIEHIHRYVVRGPGGGLYGYRLKRIHPDAGE